jgi:hypothetical protein
MDECWEYIFISKYQLNPDVYIGSLAMVEDCCTVDSFSYNRVVCKVTLSSPCLWASFHPVYPLSVVSAK